MNHVKLYISNVKSMNITDPIISITYQFKRSTFYVSTQPKPNKNILQKSKSHRIPFKSISLCNTLTFERKIFSLFCTNINTVRRVYLMVPEKKNPSPFKKIYIITTCELIRDHTIIVQLRTCTPLNFSITRNKNPISTKTHLENA